MTDRDYVGEFCAFYHEYHGISVDRRTKQERVCRAFLLSVGGVAGVNAEALESYLGTLVGALQPTTIHQYHGFLMPFLTWLWKQKAISAEALMELREVKPPRGAKRRRPRPYKRTEIRAFWAELEEAYPWCACGDCKPGVRIDHAETFLARWQRGTSQWKRVEAYFVRAQVEAIVALALFGGIRREEIFRLELEDIHPDNEYVVVRGAAKNKNAENVNRIVPWGAHDQMSGPVGRWLELRALLAPDHDRVWLCLYRGHRTKPLRFTKFKQLLPRVGNGYELHRFRHTFATESLRAGMELERLQRILGHSRPSQTLEYAELLGGDLVTSSRRTGPGLASAIGRPLEEAA